MNIFRQLSVLPVLIIGCSGTSSAAVLAKYLNGTNSKADQIGLEGLDAGDLSVTTGGLDNGAFRSSNTSGSISYQDVEGALPGQNTWFSYDTYAIKSKYGSSVVVQTNNLFFNLAPEAGSTMSLSSFTVDVAAAFASNATASNYHGFALFYQVGSASSWTKVLYQDVLAKDEASPFFLDLGTFTVNLSGISALQNVTEEVRIAIAPVTRTSYQSQQILFSNAIFNGSLVSAIPEPGTFVLGSLGLFLVSLRRRRF